MYKKGKAQEKPPMTLPFNFYKPTFSGTVIYAQLYPRHQAPLCHA